MRRPHRNSSDSDLASATWKLANDVFESLGRLNKSISQSSISMSFVLSTVKLGRSHWTLNPWWKASRPMQFAPSRVNAKAATAKVESLTHVKHVSLRDCDTSCDFRR